MHVAGDIGITFLPVPRVHVADVSLGDVPQAAETDPKTPMMAFKLLSVQLALGPLFSGEIEAHSLHLEEPVIHLRRFADGSNNWTMLPDRSPDPASPDGGMSDHQAVQGQESDVEPPSTEMIPLALSDIHIEGGRLFYHDAVGGVLTLQDIDLDMTVQSMRGPFSGDATWDMNSVPLALDFAVDAVTFDQPFAIDLALRLTDADGQARLRGDYEFADGGRWKFSGRAGVSGSSLSKTLAAVATALDPSFSDRPVVTDIAAHKYQLEGDLVVDGDDLTVNDMTIRFADLQASGGMNATLGDAVDIDLAVAFGRLDLDSMLEMVTPSAEPVGAGVSGADQEKQAGRAVTVRANLVSPAVLYRGKPIRDVVADMVFSNHSVRLKGLRAHSPGGGRAELSGALDLTVTPPVLRGNIAFQSDNLRPDLQWLGMDIDAIPGDRLRNFIIEARLKGDTKNLEFTDIDFNFDQSKGKAAAVIAVGERPGLGMSFNIDGIDVDAYRPKKTKDNQGMTGDGWGGDLLSKNWLDIGFDANLRGRLGSLRFGGMPVRELSLDLSFDHQSLVFKKVSFDDWSGIKADISGRIDGSGVLPKLDLSVTAASADIAGSLKRLGGTPSPLTQRLGAVTVNADLAGGLNEVRYEGMVDAGGGQLTLDGVVKSLMISPQIDADLEGRFPSFAATAGILFPGYRPAGDDLGPLVVTSRLAGDFQTLDFSPIKAQLGAINLQAEGALDLTQEMPHLRATINTGEVVLDPFLPVSPTTKRHGYRDPPSPFLIKTGTAARNIARHWSRAPYDLSVLQNLSMDVALSGQSLRYGSYHITSPRVNVTGDGDLFRLAPVSGSLFGGTIGLEAALNVTSVPDIQMMLNWRGVDVGMALKHFGHPDRAQGALDLTLDVSGTGESPAALISSLEGRSQIIIQDPVLRGFNLAAIGQRLNDAQGVRGILDILGAASAGGQTDFETIESNFVINNGVISEEQIELVSDAGTGAVKALIDLPRYVLDVHTRFSLASPANAPPLVVMLQGPIDRPTYKWVTKGIEEYLVTRGVRSLLDEFLPGISGPSESKRGPETPPGKPPVASPSGAGDQPGLPPAGTSPLPDIKDELRNMLEQLLP